MLKKLFIGMLAMGLILHPAGSNPVVTPEEAELCEEASYAEVYSDDWEDEEALPDEHEEPMNESQIERPMDNDCYDLKDKRNAKLTFYCTCEKCCGVWAQYQGITASGKPVEYGYTCGSNDYPLGTLLWIEGYGLYEVMDTGNMASGVIDICVASHEEAIQRGVDYTEVYVVDRR